METEWTIKNFNITFKGATPSVRDVENPNTQFGKIWANFLRELDSINAHVADEATLSGATGVIKLPTKVLAGTNTK